MVVGEAGDNSPLEPAHAQHPAPVLAVDPDGGPAARAVLPEAGARVVLDGHLELGGVELGVLEAGPDGGDVGRVGGYAQAQGAVHVGAELQLGRLGSVGGGGAAGAGAAAAGEGELGEAVRDGLELHQGRELDVHVGLAHLGLHDHLDRVRAQHPDGNVLRDDLFVVPPEAGLDVLRAEELVVVGEGVVGGGGPACPGGVPRRGRGGGDGHGQHGEAALLGEPEGGGEAVEGRLERPLEGLEGQLEVDCVGGLVGLDDVVFKDEVHR